MPATVSNQSVVDLVRESLNDDEKIRWTDAECLKYLQDAMDYLYNMRPDMFYTQLTTFDSSTLTLDSDGDETFDSVTDGFPLPNRHRRTIADYILMRCQTKDDEAVSEGIPAVTYRFFKEQAFGIV